MRLYAVEWSDSRRGWIVADANKSQKVANDKAEALAKKYNVAARAIRKPHGWTLENPESPMFCPQGPLVPSVAAEVPEARKLKGR